MLIVWVLIYGVEEGLRSCLVFDFFTKTGSFAVKFLPLACQF